MCLKRWSMGKMELLLSETSAFGDKLISRRLTLDSVSEIYGDLRLNLGVTIVR